LAQETQDHKTAVDKFLERDAVVSGDGREASMQLVLFVFGTDIESGAMFWH
jgi:hypothetical protein